MDSSMERQQSPLVVFGPDHIDTSRAEMLVECLSNLIIYLFINSYLLFKDDKIKEKRFKLKKMIGINEGKILLKSVCFPLINFF
jgi:hypothetical protein